MTKNRDHLTIYYNEPAQDIPFESRDVFVQLIKDGEKPSEALQSIIRKYDLKKLDHSITFAFLSAAYPNMNITSYGFSSRIIDANYPNNKDGFGDHDFDNTIDQIKDGCDSW